MKSRKAPPGMNLILKDLETFENQMRAAVNSSIEQKMRNEMTWPVHKTHYLKNRFISDAHYKHQLISKKLLDYLIKEGIADGKLISKWRKPGYERLCSMQAITKSNTNFGTTSVCRVPLRDRHGQILPNVMTGCVSCASGDGGPIWWDDPVPEIVIRKAVQNDPGKMVIVEEAEGEEFEEVRREIVEAAAEREKEEKRRRKRIMVERNGEENERKQKRGEIRNENEEKEGVPGKDYRKEMEGPSTQKSEQEESSQTRKVKENVTQVEKVKSDSSQPAVDNSNELLPNTNPTEQREEAVR